MMYRRDFIKALSLLGVSSALPFGFSQAWAAQSPLPVPGILRADTSGRISIRIDGGFSQWRTKPTRTYGYNGSLLGPVIAVQRGQRVVMDIQNNLSETTAVHWHGLEIPGTSDGGPQQIMDAGTGWKPELYIDQPAATCWFHPHPHAKTGRQVAMGLAGLFLIEDEASKTLPLPKTWGVDDIPVILQDKRLNKDDQIDYTMDVMRAAVGWFGDFLLTNGALYPSHAVPRGWVRLRLLNGCNARSLRVACSDQRPMYVIASDGGFLAEPIKLTELSIFMGERFEILVDTRDGKNFDLMTLPVRQIGMTVAPFDKPVPALHIMPTQQTGHTVLPDSLVALPPIPDTSKMPVRMFTLSMNPWLDMEGMRELVAQYGEGAMAGMSMDHGNMGDMMDHGNMGSHSGMMNHGAAMNHGSMANQHSMMGQNMMQAPKGFNLWYANMINNKAFEMNTVYFDVKRNHYERWVVSGKGDMMLHPFHVHGTQFRILKENGLPPAAHRRGWKDTTFVEGDESEILVKFAHPAPAERMYMAHCHLLEHEDTGMMTSFTVTD